MQFGYSYHLRIEALDAAEPNGRPDQEVEFQGVMKRFVQYRVPIGLPRYRLNNGRTGAAQAEYIKVNNLDEDFFSADSEQDHVQKAQHEILTGMTEGAGLQELFEQVATRQNKTLILMSDGHVTDGNRRLALMRNLLENDPTTYSHFSHIDVIRLPPADEIDVVRLEAWLQLAPDVKDGYGWVSKVLMVRKAVLLGMSYKQAASLYEYKDEKEARKMLRTLELAETYLESRSMAEEYSQVSEDAFAFMEMEKLAAKQKTWAFKKRVSFQQLCFGCIDDPSRMGGRVMGQIRDIHNSLDAIIEEVEQEHAKIIFAEEIPEETSEDYDLLGGTDPTDESVGLWNEIGQTEDDDELMETVTNTIQRVKAQEKAEKTDKFVFSRIKEADKILQNVLKNKKNSMSKEGVVERITSLETKLKALKEWVKNG